jgi:YfiH family protein
VRLGSGLAAWTDRRQGDLGPSGAPDPEALERRRRQVVDLPWSWLRQVHGSRVVVVERPGAGAGEMADALVSTSRGACLAVLTADCVPLALGSDEGAIAAVHVGWRGLLAGVVAAAVEAMRGLGASRVEGAIGPCIHAECYEFSRRDLARVEDRFGPAVRSATRGGRPALDMPAAVGAALEEARAELVWAAPVCTSCSPLHFSYRARRDTARQALAVWRP